MTRFLVLFGALLLIALLLMAGMLAQNGYSLMDPAMTPMVFAAVLVAGYVSWRINGILKRRDQSRGASLDKTGGKSGGIFSSKPSAAQSARAARVAARRKKLISEGEDFYKINSILAKNEVTLKKIMQLNCQPKAVCMDRDSSVNLLCQAFELTEAEALECYGMTKLPVVDETFNTQSTMYNRLQFVEF